MQVFSGKGALPYLAPTGNVPLTVGVVFRVSDRNLLKECEGWV